MFRFLHTADIHLDSPLRGLERYEGAPSDEIRQATRRALANLVTLAIDQQVAFVLIAGDLYDGDWHDHNTGLYFVSQMARLHKASIRVFLIAGNHDAANRMTKTLRMPGNVQLLSHRRPETVTLDALGAFDVAIHGQSFARAAITADLAADYPAALPGHFNIGMLHTSATGREGHEPYAPCTIETLQSKEYDYWALGHVHNRELLCSEPPILFAGNLQGRHIRETGPKGCTLVTVDDANRPTLESQTLDVFRWEVCHIDATGAATADELLKRFRQQLATLIVKADDRPLAVRVMIEGPCEAHRQIAAMPLQWTNELRAAAIETSDGRVWIEKVRLKTSLPVALDDLQADEGPVGELLRFIAELKADPAKLDAMLHDELAQLQKKLPTELVEGPDAVACTGQELGNDALDQVEQMLIRRLLAREDAS